MPQVVQGINDKGNGITWIKQAQEINLKGKIFKIAGEEALEEKPKSAVEIAKIKGTIRLSRSALKLWGNIEP